LCLAVSAHLLVAASSLCLSLTMQLPIWLTQLPHAMDLCVVASWASHGQCLHGSVARHDVLGGCGTHLQARRQPTTPLRAYEDDAALPPSWGRFRLSREPPLISSTRTPSDAGGRAGGRGGQPAR
jgi:hypothetical protein